MKYRTLPGFWLIQIKYQDTRNANRETIIIDENNWIYLNISGHEGYYGVIPEIMNSAYYLSDKNH